MAKFVLLDCRLFTGGLDMSGRNNKIELMAEQEVKDATSWGQGGTNPSKQVIGGVAKSGLNGSGQWDAGDDAGEDQVPVDAEMWDRLVARDVVPWSACPDDAGVGDLAWILAGLSTSYQLGGQIGDVAPWAAKASSNWPLIRGRIAHPPGSARTGDGNGTALELGAVPAGQRLYAALHVLSVAGTNTPEIDVIIQSDTTDDFDDTPETRIAFSTATAPVGEILRDDPGAHADTWYRASWDITDNGGTGESFLFVVSLGIGT